MNAKDSNFFKMMRGYLGFCTGRGKSLSTVSSYKGDLQLLEKFLRERKKDFFALKAKDFETYVVWMEKQGLKMNTRRRKIITAKSLVKYAVSRKKMSDAGRVHFVKAPERLERLPWIPNEAQIKVILQRFDLRTPLGLRNRLVVQLLVETGLSLAELCALRWDQLGSAVEVGGKRPRQLEISAESQEFLRLWRAHNPGKHLFPGFNRHGITSEKMTPRGVELFFKNLAKHSGFKQLKPKTLRHYAIVKWLKENVADKEILLRLGVHPNYSLDAYKKIS